MVHQRVFELFTLYFPNYSNENAEVWFANGKNSIRVRLKDKRELIFTYSGQDNWKLETMKSFLGSREEKNNAK